MQIGFHIKFSGNLKRLTKQMEKTRGNAFQFYSRSIRGNRIPEVNERQLYAYYNFLFERKISTVIMLAPYYFQTGGQRVSANLAVDNPAAVREMVRDLEFAEKIHAKYYVVQAGYKKELSETEAKNNLKRQLQEILEKTDWKGTILVRNMAGAGTEFGADLDEWKEIVCFHERIKGALDFARLFVYGYDFLQEMNALVLLNTIKEEIGWENIPLLYINDANRFSGSKKDVPVPLGEGVIGFYGYQNLLFDKYVKEKIWMVENQPDITYMDKTMKFLLSFHKSNGFFDG